MSGVVNTYWVATDAHVPGCLPTDGGVSVHADPCYAWGALSLSAVADCWCDENDLVECGWCRDAGALAHRSSAPSGPGVVTAAEGLAIYTVEPLYVEREPLDRDALIDAATETVLWSQCRELGPDADGESWPVDMSTTFRLPIGAVRERMRRVDREDVRRFVAEWVDEWVAAVDVEDLRMAVRERGERRIGHSLILSAAGHGSGLWDEGLGDAGARLSDEARRSIGDVTVWVSPRDRGGWRRVEGIDR